MSEKQLRDWVKSVMGNDVDWVEPNFGSSVGRPDAEFHIKGQLLPVELKFWERGGKTKTKIMHNMRPSQIRYHTLTAKKGMKSAILFGVPFFNVDLGFLIYLLAGKYCPTPSTKNFEHVGPFKLICCNTEQQLAKERIVATLTSKEFWQ